MSSEQTIERIQKAIKKAFEKDPAYEGMEIEFYDFKVRNPVSTNIEVGIVQIGTFKYDIALFVPKYECSAREYVVDSLREEFPNISLGTVYRNLTLLSDMGELLRLRVGDGMDHFDATTAPHYHFICNTCGCVIDLDMDSIDSINDIAGTNFGGRIEGHVAYFHGTCENCTDHS